MNQEPLTPEELDEIANECFQNGLDFIADLKESQTSHAMRLNGKSHDAVVRIWPPTAAPSVDIEGMCGPRGVYG